MMNWWLTYSANLVWLLVHAVDLVVLHAHHSCKLHFAVDASDYLLTSRINDILETVLNWKPSNYRNDLFCQSKWNWPTLFFTDFKGICHKVIFTLANFTALSSKCWTNWPPHIVRVEPRPALPTLFEAMGGHTFSDKLDHLASTYR